MGYFLAQLTLNVTPKKAVRSRVTARAAESFPLNRQGSRQSLGNTRRGRAKADWCRQGCRHFDEVQHWRGFPGDLRGMHVSKSIEVYRPWRGLGREYRPLQESHRLCMGAYRHYCA